MIVPSILYHTITFQGITTDANKITSFVEKTPTNRPCHIQQITDVEGALDDNVVGNQYHCFLDEVGNAKKGDKAVDGNGKQYQVVGIAGYPYSASSHAQITLSDEN